MASVNENENIHQEMYIITTAKPTQNSIGPSIRIGREILCLQYVVFFMFQIIVSYYLVMGVKCH